MWTKAMRSLALLSCSATLLCGPFFLLCCADENAARGSITVNPDGTIEKSPAELSLDKELKAAYDDAKNSLSVYRDAKSNLSTLSESLAEDAGAQHRVVMDQLREMEQAKEDILEIRKRIDEAIRNVNAQQILDLKEKISVLQQREMKRRAKLKEKKQLEKKSARMKHKGIPEDAIKKEDLKELINVEKIMEKSDAELEEWFIQFVQREVAKLQDQLEETVIDATQKISEVGENDAAALFHREEEDCSGASLADAVQLVQESLVKYSQDKVGMADHSARAAIVHHLTSNNYVPAYPPHQQIEFAWWFQYVPEDLERLLDMIFPSGWKQWPAKLPDPIFHTLGLTRQASTAPPEAILKPDINPGSCWPMAGRSGQVTLRLAYPVKVKAVTLDHTPAMLLDDEEKRKSAPKQLRVFGYPPCWTKKKKSSDAKSKDSDYLDDYAVGEGNGSLEDVRGVCEDGLDFDVTKPIVLVDFEYDLDGPTIQTFHLASDEEDEGTCTDSTGTCGGRHMFSSVNGSDDINDGVAAVGLEILDNWGNEDYTCVYRFRIHGDAIIHDS